MHWVQALVAPSELLHSLPSRISSAVVRELPQGLSLVPITEALAQDLIDAGIASGDPTPMPAEEMTPGVAALARELSEKGTVLYVATFIHGGIGGQDAIVWRGGSVVLQLGETEDSMSGWPNSSISRALRFAGVKTRKGEDEFDAIGLGTHRSNESWATGTGPVTPSSALDVASDALLQRGAVPRPWWQFWR